MIHPLELYIGLRYTLTQRSNHFISFISFISMLGMALGIWALIIVLSVMNGFGNEIRTRTLGVVSHVTVVGNLSGLDNWEKIDSRIKGQEHVTGSAPYISGQGMLVHNRIKQGVMVRGVLPAREAAVSEIEKKLLSGKLTDLVPGKFKVMLGSTLAWRLGVEPGSSVMLLIPDALATPAGILPRFKRFTVAGVFDVGVHQYDSGLAVIHMEDAARLYRMADSVSGLRLRLTDLNLAPRVAHEVQYQLGAEYLARDWTYQHANLYRMLKIEKRMMWVILFLIVVVAGLNIVSTMVMAVTDKRADIAILRTLGIRPGSIMGIFMIQGTIIGTVGTLLGTIGGVLTALNVESIVKFIEGLLESDLFPADVYMISDLPSEVYWSDVTIVASISLIMGIVATLYPAWRAARVQPAQALRYE